MSKRQIIITIDCEEDLCEQCDFVGHGGICKLFEKSLPIAEIQKKGYFLNKFARCDECLFAEKWAYKEC